MIGRSERPMRDIDVYAFVAVKTNDSRSIMYSICFYSVNVGQLHVAHTALSESVTNVTSNRSIPQSGSQALMTCVAPMLFYCQEEFK